jgi:hypothetical protein
MRSAPAPGAAQPHALPRAPQLCRRTAARAAGDFGRSETARARAQAVPYCGASSELFRLLHCHCKGCRFKQHPDSTIRRGVWAKRWHRTSSAQPKARGCEPAPRAVQQHVHMAAFAPPRRRQGPAARMQGAGAGVGRADGSLQELSGEGGRGAPVLLRGVQARRRTDVPQLACRAGGLWTGHLSPVHSSPHSLICSMHKHQLTRACTHIQLEVMFRFLNNTVSINNATSNKDSHHCIISNRFALLGTKTCTALRALGVPLSATPACPASASSWWVAAAAPPPSHQPPAQR